MGHWSVDKNLGEVKYLKLF